MWPLQVTNLNSILHFVYDDDDGDDDDDDDDDDDE